MQIALSILGGAVWGLLAALLSAVLLLTLVPAAFAASSKSDIKSVSLCNMLRFFIDAGALAIVFLMRAVIPMDFTAAIIATAAAMSIFTIVFTFRLARPDGKSEENKPE